VSGLFGFVAKEALPDIGHLRRRLNPYGGVSSSADRFAAVR